MEGVDIDCPLDLNQNTDNGVVISKVPFFHFQAILEAEYQAHIIE